MWLRKPIVPLPFLIRSPLIKVIMAPNVGLAAEVPEKAMKSPASPVIKS